MAGSYRWLPPLVILALSGNGCAVNNSDMLHFLREHQHQVSAIEYRVGIPDVIGVSAPRVLEIDGESQRLQPDGKINLRLLGEVKVAGMTTKELAAKFEVLLGRYYVDPKVSVRVLAYISKRYYVIQGLDTASSRPYTGRDTLIDAVLTSGISFLWWTSRVKVIRPSHGEVPVRTITVNVDKMVKTGDWAQNILLEPGDVVYIPSTPIGWLARRLQELVYPVSPLVETYAAPATLLNIGQGYDRDENGIYRTRGAGVGQGF